MWFLLVILLIIATLLWASVSYFYKVAIKRAPKPMIIKNTEQVAGDKLVSTSPDYSWIRAQSPEQVEITSFDGLKLCGTWIPGKGKENKIVILSHGYTGRGYEMAGFARFYVEELGFRVLMPDHRGHGASEGDYIGFGWHDRLDYMRWIDFVIKKMGENSEILLHGISMGAASVLMASGEKLPSQVKGIISDCGYTSVKDELSYQMKQMFKLPSFPFIPLISLYTRWKAGYSFREASALKQVKRTHLPILYIHGGEDTFVPTSMAHELYRESAGDKYLYIVPEAAHGTSFLVEPEGYKRHVKDFVARYLGQGTEIRTEKWL
ncbi:alpha/beta hydrolase [Paenibacillus gallinarum]|uniref:Alpha/beta hydrolase n=1 Tax=Paenibacillus gallinarum TaxID=2762232 RepID=A0ABR8SUF2_9BACL|nr:alpha/beta hydrolase [Paenibacillus gallinarum]MBD7967135.1 alpha/beta hydrolase [Paenibacillus gallinarum]